MTRFRGRTAHADQAGYSLIETLVALAVFAAVAVVFVTSFTTADTATAVADTRQTAESLARSQMEYARRLPYTYDATTYAAETIPADSSYDGFSAQIMVTPLQNPDAGVQKLTVIVSHSGSEIRRLEGYKTDR